MTKAKHSDIEVWYNYTKNVLPLNKKEVIVQSNKKSFIVKKKYIPEKQIDMHNMTIQDSYNLFNEFIENSYTANVTKITVITGKSGEIKKEMPKWENNKIKKIIENPNGGSFSVILKKG